MKQRALIDVICKAGLQKLAGEVGALLGQMLSCSDIKLRTCSKDQLFSNPSRAKTVLTRMSVSGDREGNCYLLNPISSAAILGGTLIMLPDDVIAEASKSGSLEGEINDAFGEVANIIAGVMTQAFVDKYPKALRFIKKSTEELVPTKIDPESDAPFPPGNYYIASCEMSIDETDLGIFEFVVPLAVFDLEETASPQTADAPEKGAESTAAVDAAPPEASEPSESAPAAAPETTAAPTPEPAVKKPKFAEAKKLVDVVFNTTIGQMGEEMGALLGQTLKCSDIQLLMTTKADLFSTHCLEKSILTQMKVSGDKTGAGYLLTRVPDAIAMGGTLIMLPDDQIALQMNHGEFAGEVSDAFGEIANILAGSLTQVFLDRYPKPLRFVRTESEMIVPTKVDVSSDQPFAEGSFYLASFAIHMEEYELHRLLLIFPAEVFDLEAPAEAPPSTQANLNDSASTTAAVSTPVPDQTSAPGEQGAPVAATAGAAVPTPAAAATPEPAPAGPPIVIIISDQQNTTDPFVEILSSASYNCRVLSFQDDIKQLLQQHQVLGIFLIMAQVGEKGFAAAIKLQSAGRTLPPLIFAGEQWTRSAVLRAVKYGARDILVTPASTDEIQEKVSQHFKKAS